MTPPESFSNIPKAVFFDLDGTLFVEDQILPGAQELVQYIRSLGLNIFFVSNNSARNTKEYFNKLSSLGFNPSLSEIHSSLNAGIHYLKEQGHTNIYPLAVPAVEEELLSEGFSYDSNHPTAVFLTYDLSFTFDKFIKAHRHLTQGSVFIATHPDIFCPAHNIYLPDIGCLLAAFNASGFQPETIVGKPSPQMVLPLIKSKGFLPQECLMIGDRIQTDMKLARSAGMQKALILTGDSSRTQARSAGIPRDEIFSDLLELIEKLKSEW